MKVFVLAVASYAISVLAQDIDALSSLIKEVTVTSDDSGFPSLFPSETVQLTDDVIAAISRELQDNSTASLFMFGSDALSTANSTAKSHCKPLPGDSSWPSPSEWNTFNSLLGGSLIKASPAAAACYGLEYSAEKCASIISDWDTEGFQTSDPTSVMDPLYVGRSCMPPGLNYTNTCDMGAYPTYVVNVSSVAQIQLAVNFARNKGLRFVVKNTGHDLIGKASGKGALSVWTHWLKDKAYYPNFVSKDYTGPAIKFGAGVQVREAYEYAKSVQATVLGGESQSVGLAGWSMGGGHSPLSSLYGLGADQIVSIEVVLANGQFITANAEQNSDVFWMLRGGGGSTIGVMTSLTMKAYPQLPATTVTFNFTAVDGPALDAFWTGIESYVNNMQAFVDAGTYGYYALAILEDSAGNERHEFQMRPFFAPNMTIAETKTLLSPWFDVLDMLNISYNPVYTYKDNFYDAWYIGFPEETVGSDTTMISSRLMPRYVFENDTSRNQLFKDGFKNAVDNGILVIGLQLSGKGIAVDPPTDTAVLPAWRNTTTHLQFVGRFSATADWAIIQNQTLFVTNYTSVLRTLAPDSGCYLSEADFLEPNLQDAFYGVNYPQLYELKKTYDPTSLFFALTAVGSEDWEVQVEDPLPYSWNNNGRLCRKTT
ncbi:conserved hypothetical protein [Talaromyces stipitatus ATCC 10500]|uniref:FAD-binding PCMH-type domain-containing protein n=1 Tax=Talaromyces stipitatus (strain ATCC 10500 / CBS 375.48 / QM 6759 / NRRL 1006) TaxID=441959 RepID=B8MB58_TALSN|nr:uncharacterized protein TSTA_125610 [Talaromyces stipitatus ATCC 10500]EED18847.1 conserved hypothetical protein [Talaromyces stipitatus ATCC 10500]